MAALGSGGEKRDDAGNAQSSARADAPENPGSAASADASRPSAFPEGPPPATLGADRGAARDVTVASLRDLPGPPLRDDDDVFAVPKRPRASPLRVLGIAIASILVTAVLFRAAVEAVRIFVVG